MIPITFGALAMSTVTKIMFGCTPTSNYLCSKGTLLEKYFAFVGDMERT